MRVCIDIQPAVAQRAGVGRYVSCLVEHLGRTAGTGEELALFYFDFKRHGLSVHAPGAHHRAVRWLPGRIAQQAWKTIHWPPFNWFAGPADVYHFPNFIAPPCSAGHSVVTIHDMAFMRFPETIEARNYRYLTTRIRDTVSRADAIITVSDFTAGEVVELLSVPPEKVHAIPEGLTGRVLPSPEEDVRALRQQLDLDSPYLLHVGTLEPRKNISFLIEAFERMRFDGQLVLAGMPGWKYEPLMEQMKRSPKAGSIRYIRFVDDALLSALYSGAEAFLFPSLYEGFGFPPLEAMACGTAVLASRAGSLPEVLGDAAITLDTDDPVEWAEATDALLGDSTKRKQLRERGLAHVRRYDWAETARRTWEVYRQVAGS